MDGDMILVLPVIVHVLAGVLVLVGKVFRKDRKSLTGFSVLVLAAELALTLWALMTGGSLTVLKLTDQITLGFHVDEVSRVFAGLTAVVWLLVGIYSVAYMSHEEEEHRFFGFYLIVAGVLMGLNFSADMITLYVFFELMTLTSLPLVLHERSRQAVQAGLKYLFYSVAGAFLALFGIFFLAGVSESLTFAAGGVLSDAAFGALHNRGVRGQGRHVPSSWMAAYGPSRGTGLCQRGTFRSDYESRCFGHSQGCVLYHRGPQASGNLGSECMDSFDAFDRVYGVYAGIQGACA